MTKEKPDSPYRRVLIYFPFGYHHRSAPFQRLSDTVLHIMRQKGYDVMNYIDDTLRINVPSKTDTYFDTLQVL